MAARRKTTAGDPGVTHGWRSGLEKLVSAALSSLRVAYEYEAFRIPFIEPAKKRHYTPDFLLPNGIVVETKGRFITADRQKHVLLKQQHPDIDIRFVFQNPNARISKTSRTTYADWCEKHGFLYAARSVPAAWIAEPTNRASLKAIKEIRKDG